MATSITIRRANSLARISCILREKPDPYIADQLEEAKAKLLELRSLRTRPHLDDKILTAWNGAHDFRIRQSRAASG